MAGLHSRDISHRPAYHKRPGLGKIGLALWLNQRVNLRGKFWMLLFGLVSAAS